LLSAAGGQAYLSEAAGSECLAHGLVEFLLGPVLSNLDQSMNAGALTHSLGGGLVSSHGCAAPAHDYFLDLILQSINLRIRIAFGKFNHVGSSIPRFRRYASRSSSCVFRTHLRMFSFLSRFF